MDKRSERGIYFDREQRGLKTPVKSGNRSRPKQEASFWKVEDASNRVIVNDDKLEQIPETAQ